MTNVQALFTFVVSIAMIASVIIVKSGDRDAKNPRKKGGRDVFN